MGVFLLLGLAVLVYQAYRLGSGAEPYEGDSLPRFYIYLIVGGAVIFCLVGLSMVLGGSE